MTTTASRGRSKPFDIGQWMDEERQAAERRVGCDEPEAVTQDARDSRALDIWSRWDQAQQQIVQARQAIDLAEHDARAL